MPDALPDSLATPNYTADAQREKLRRLERARRNRWADQLFTMVKEMDLAAGEGGSGDVEALVRIAWKMLYEENQRAEKAVF